MSESISQLVGESNIVLSTDLALGRAANNDFIETRFGQRIAWQKLRKIRIQSLTDESVPPYLFWPEARELIDQARSIDAAILYELLYVTGARIGEALSLTKESFYLERDEPHVIIPTFKQRGRRAGKAKRLIFLPAAFVPILKQWAASKKGRHTDKLFTFSARSVQRWLEDETVIKDKMGTAIGAIYDCGKVTPHTFRHSCAVFLALRGFDEAYIAKYLGHADTSTTKVYLQVPAALMQAAQGHAGF